MPTCPLDQNTSQSQKKAENLAAKGSSSIGSKHTIFGHLAKENLCVFFFQALLFFSTPSYLGKNIFLGTFQARFTLRVLRREVDTAPLIKVTGDGTTHSLPVHSEAKQPEYAHPASCPQHVRKHLHFSARLAYPHRTQLHLGVCCSLSPYSVFVKTQSHTAFHECKGNSSHHGVCLCLYKCTVIYQYVCQCNSSLK